MAAELKWHIDLFRRVTDRQLAAGLKAAAQELKNIARQKAGIHYPPASRPGESPRRRTGWGQQNIDYIYLPQQKVARVGYGRLARYMMFHELGIHYRRVGFQRRPTIWPGLQDNAPRIEAVGAAAAKRAAGGGSP